MKLILASNNAGKLAEMREILSEIAPNTELLSQREAGCLFEVEETGETFEENAYLKARAVAEATGTAAVADDSGLAVDALGGAPGVRSARYTGRHEDSDEDRYSLLLRNLEGAASRRARFVSCVCCVFPNGDRLTARGECEGEITLAPCGEGGFGYDPVFRPEGFEKTMGELTPEEKNAISHRGRAFRAFAKELEKYLSKGETETCR